ncbi:unnamed protein product [Prorocentrum cordatum]|uniref:RNA-directed RNA polymerase n=1 Tax=Prorocentrum cordatum TaxID=2364126 RepID=A0ABN9U6F4_9DINO|nr:unnamed protein product [Polarella glacialis]
MPPKGKAKASPATAKAVRGKAQATRDRESADGQPGTYQCGLGTYNAKYYAKLDAAEETIMQHDLFKNIGMMGALKIQTIGEDNDVSSHIAPFDKADCRIALQSRSIYDCGFNAFHLLLKSSMSKSVPINEHAVLEFAKANFVDSNDVFPSMIHTAVEKDTDDVESLFGKLPVLSPEEPRHAFLFKLAERISAGADHDEIMGWQQMARSVTVRIHVMENNNDRIWLGTVLRNRIAQQYDLVVRTTPQLIVELAMHKQRMQSKYSPENLAAEFNTHIRKQSGSKEDEITGSLVDQAITVWNRCLSATENMEIVMGNVNTYGHNTVFNGVGNLQAIVSKGSTSHNIKWLIQDMDDQFRNGGISQKGLALRDMQGTKGKVSWPEKSLYRMSVLKHLRDSWLEIQPCPAALKAKLRDLTESHKSWRKGLGFSHNGGEVDQSWKGEWPVYMDIAVELFSVVFDNTRDSDIEEQCKKASAEEFVEQHLGSHLNDWAECFKTEDKQKEDAGAAVSETAPAPQSSIPAQVKEAPPEISKAIQDMGFTLKDPDDVETLQAFYSKARTLVRTFVTLVPEEATVGKMASKLEELPIHRVQGKSMESHTSYFAFLYTLNLSGEVATAPHVRMMSYRKDAYQKAVDVFLGFRGSPTVFPDTDVAIVLDGYKHGLKAQMFSAWQVDGKAVMKDETTYSLIYDADQLQSRLGCIRGWKMQQVEWMHVIHNPNGLNLKIRKRLHYEGTNRWEIMQPVRFNEWKDSWHMSYEEKLSFFGSHRHDVGGSSGIPVPKRNPKDFEPLFYHSPEPNLFDEQYHCFDMAGALDWNAGEGFAAVPFIRWRKPYVGICFKMSHVTGLYQRLELLALMCMLRVDDELYDPKFAALMENSSSKKDDSKPQPKMKRTSNNRGQGGSESKPDGDDETPPKKAKTGKGNKADKANKSESRAELLKLLEGMGKGPKKDKAGKAGAAEEPEGDDSEPEEEEDEDMEE